MNAVTPLGPPGCFYQAARWHDGRWRRRWNHGSRSAAGRIAAGGRVTDALFLPDRLAP